MMTYPTCEDSRICKFKMNGVCRVLNEAYKKDRACPFCKEEAKEEREFEQDPK